MSEEEMEKTEKKAKGRFEISGPADEVEDMAKRMAMAGVRTDDQDDDQDDDNENEIEEDVSPTTFEDWYEHLSENDPGAKVWIERVEPREVDGRRIRVGSLASYKISGMPFTSLEEKIAKNWGGGEYGLDLRDYMGRVRRRRIVTVDGDPARGEFLSEDSGDDKPQAPVPPPADPRIDALMAAVAKLSEKSESDRVMSILMEHFKTQQAEAKAQAEERRLAHERALEQMKLDRETAERKAQADADRRKEDLERQFQFMKQMQDQISESQKKESDPLEKMLQYHQFYSGLKGEVVEDGEGKGVMGHVGDFLKVIANMQAGQAVQPGQPGQPVPALPDSSKSRGRRARRPSPVPLPQPEGQPEAVPGAQEIDVDKQAKALMGNLLNRILDGLLIEVQTRPRAIGTIDALLDHGPEDFLDALAGLESFDKLGDLAGEWGLSKTKLLALKAHAEDNPKAKAWLARFWEELQDELRGEPEDEDGEDGDDMGMVADDSVDEVSSPEEGGEGETGDGEGDSDASSESA